MTQGGDASSPGSTIAFEGRQFVGLEVSPGGKEQAKLAEYSLEDTRGVARVFEFSSKPDGALEGGIHYYARTERDGVPVLAHQFWNVSLYPERKNDNRAGKLHSGSWFTKGFADAWHPWALIDGYEVVPSRECPVPPAYQLDALPRDDALVLLLRFKDGTLLPLSYAAPIEGEALGSRAYLEDVGRKFVAAVPRAEQASRVVQERDALRLEENRRQAQEKTAAQQRGQAKPVRGFHGTRLGEPYVYRWIDKVPTSTTWEDLHKKKGCVGGALGALALIAVCGLIWGEAGLIVSTLFLPMLGFAFGHGIATSGMRGDVEPVPRDVTCEVYIEYADGDFFFVREVNGEPDIWQPWDLVTRFEHVPYWPMFGDAGECPYKTGWHAIAMTPAIGKPWLIASTIEAQASVRERFAELDARFSADARARFMRSIELGKRTASEAPLLPADAPRAVDGVPSKL